MSIALALQSVDSTRRRIVRTYKATLSGNYTASGEVLDFSAATDPYFLGKAKPGFGATITEAQLSLPNPSGNGYNFRVQKGATLNASVLRIYESGGDGGDHDEISGAMGAALTDDANVFIQLSLPVGKS